MTFLVVVTDATGSWRDNRIARSLCHAAERDLHQIDIGDVGDRIVIWSAFDRLHDTAVHLPSGLAVGSARLYRVPRPELDAQHSEEDLQTVGEALALRDGSALAALPGVFCTVHAHAASGRVAAARDALGECRLFYRMMDHGIAIANRAALLATDHSIDELYVGQFLTNDGCISDRTIYRDVFALPSGTILEWRPLASRMTRFWHADSFTPARSIDSGVAVRGFRTLFEEAVAAQLDTPHRIAAQLSGGVDSSSVLSVAQSLAQTGRANHGVTASVTMIDSLGDGDEYEFADLVTEKWEVPNRKLVDFWPWQDDGSYPLLCDEPYLHYPYFARERALCTLLDSFGCSVMLTGIGSDQYLGGNTGYVLDHFAHGQLGRGIRAVMDLAIERRRSVWNVGYKEIVRPLVRRIPAHRQHRELPPAWIQPAFSARVDWSALAEQRIPEGRWGSRFADVVGWQVTSFSRALLGGASADRFDARHPFLYRPLVEFCLRLPSEWRVTARDTKVVLRRALAGVVPDAILARSGKGGIGARIRWALAHEKRRLRELMANSILADAGIIDAKQVDRALERLTRKGRGTYVHLLRVLALETWLQVRAGTWVVRESCKPDSEHSSKDVDPTNSLTLERVQL